MSEYIHLIGAEDVSRAGRQIDGAADTMRRTIDSLESTLERHKRFMDDWLNRFETILEKKDTA